MSVFLLACIFETWLYINTYVWDVWHRIIYCTPSQFVWCIALPNNKLDESMARRHLKSPWSPRSLHLTFQGHGQGQTWLSMKPSIHFISLLFILWQSNHLWLIYSKFQIWLWKFIAKVKSDGHIWGIEFNQYVSFLFRGNRTMFYQDVKVKVKVTAKVKSYCHIWGLEFDQHLCFLFHGNWTFFGRDIVNFVFDLENSRSRSQPRSNPMVIFEA